MAAHTLTQNGSAEYETATSSQTILSDIHWSWGVAAALALDFLTIGCIVWLLAR